MSDNPYLRLISGNETITIPACIGGKNANIYKAKGTFPKDIDKKFVNYSTSIQPATTEICVEVYELNSTPDNFKTLFASLCPDLSEKYSFEELPSVNIKEVESSLKKNKRIFESQEQIIRFFIENRKWITVLDYGNFFLFSERINRKEIFAIANIRINFRSSFPSVDLFHLSDPNIWRLGNSFRLIIPKLESQS